MQGNKPQTRAVSFKMPLATWTVISKAAESRGMDVSSLINFMVAQQLPWLMQLDADREDAIVKAALTTDATIIALAGLKKELQELRDARGNADPSVLHSELEAASAAGHALQEPLRRVAHEEEA